MGSRISRALRVALLAGALFSAGNVRVAPAAEDGVMGVSGSQLDISGIRSGHLAGEGAYSWGAYGHEPLSRVTTKELPMLNKKSVAGSLITCCRHTLDGSRTRQSPLHPPPRAQCAGRPCRAVGSMSCQRYPTSTTRPLCSVHRHKHVHRHVYHRSSCGPACQCAPPCQYAPAMSMSTARVMWTGM